jgi:hypothetical protein
LVLRTQNHSIILSITDASFITTLFLPKTEKVLLQHSSLIIKGRGI